MTEADLQSVCPPSPIAANLNPGIELSDKPRAVSILDYMHRFLCDVATPNHVGHSTLSQVVHDIEAGNIVLHGFNRVLICVGAEDVCRAVCSGATFPELMELFLQLFKVVHEKAPDAFIMWMAIHPCVTLAKEVNKKIHAVNFALRRICADSYQGVFLDTSQIFFHHARVSKAAFITFPDRHEEFSGLTNMLLRESIQRRMPYKCILENREARQNILARSPCYSASKLRGAFDMFV